MLPVFETEQEYQAFKIWASEGSTIGQRMGQGFEPGPPDYWDLYQAGVDNLPETLSEFKARLQGFEASEAVGP